MLYMKGMVIIMIIIKKCLVILTSLIKWFYKLIRHHADCEIHAKFFNSKDAIL